MKIEQFCQNLKEYLSQFSVGRILLPLASPILFVCAGILLLDNWIAFGSLITTLAEVILIVVLLLVLASCQFRNLAIGLGILAVYNIYYVLRNLIMYHSINYYCLIWGLVFGLLTWAAYKKSLQFK